MGCEVDPVWSYFRDLADGNKISESVDHHIRDYVCSLNLSPTVRVRADGLTKSTRPMQDRRCDTGFVKSRRMNPI